MSPSPRGALSLLALLASACARGQLYDCTCTFLTDFDDGSRTVVEVCAPSAERAPAVARGCAQSAAPAPIEACTCAPAGAAPACAPGDCRAR